MTSPALDTVAATRAARSRPPQSRPVALGQPVPVCVAYGDGIGPEIMEATLAVLKAAGARLALEPVELGAKVYERGVSAGIDAGAWASLRRTRVLLKAPITTPQAGGYKSLNVTLRKTLGMFANVRPCASYHPFVSTRHPGMDLVIVRENEEDLYAGIEHRQTRDVVQCLKIVSVPGTERIVRYAFEYARAYGRAQGHLHDQGQHHEDDGRAVPAARSAEIGTEYPDLEQEHRIIDIGTAMMADEPERFDVVVTPEPLRRHPLRRRRAGRRLGRDGGFGQHRRDAAMFEAIHGSAPAIARRNFANPSGLMPGRGDDAGPHRPERRCHDACRTPGSPPSRTVCTRRTSGRGTAAASAWARPSSPRP